MNKIKELELKLANAKKEEKTKKIKVWEKSAKKYLGKCYLKGKGTDFSLFILNTDTHLDFGAIKVQVYGMYPGRPFGYSSIIHLKSSDHISIKDRTHSWGKEITREKCDKIVEYIRNSKAEYFKGLNKLANG